MPWITECSVPQGAVLPHKLERFSLTEPFLGSECTDSNGYYRPDSELLVGRDREISQVTTQSETVRIQKKYLVSPVTLFVQCPGSYVQPGYILFGETLT